MKNVALQALREGAQDYLLKSEISRNIVLRSVRFAIERKRGEQATPPGAIFECSKIAIIGMTLDGAIVSWNPAAERIFGYKLEEVSGRSISMIGRGDAPDEMPLILEWLKRGDPVKDFETVRYTKEGKLIHVSLSVSPVRSASRGSLPRRSSLVTSKNGCGRRRNGTYFYALQASLAEVICSAGCCRLRELQKSPG